jgi:gliding motility-associated-like protein
MCLYGCNKGKNTIAFLIGLVCSLLQAAHAQTGNCQPVINIAVQPQTLCSANTPTIIATASGAGTNPTYRWKKNGRVVGSNNATFSGALIVGDEIVCELIPSGCSNNNIVASNTFRFEALNLIEPEVTISASATNICADNPVTFTATNRSGNTNPVFVWMINGNPVPGSNKPTITVTNLSDGAQVQCLMTVPQCTSTGGGSTKDLSDVITIKVGQVQQAALSIATSSQKVCKGAAVTFTATATGAGNNPQYIWQVNGQPVQTGGTSFTTSSLNDGDKVQCRLEGDAPGNCGPATPVLSNLLEMEVAAAVTPTVSIATSQTNICLGTEVQFVATTTNAANGLQYQWQVSGRPAGNNDPGFVTAALADGDVVQCMVTTTSGCGALSIASNAIEIEVRNPPVLTIPEDTLRIWAGEQAQLKAIITGEPHFYQWSPQGSLLFDQTLEPLTQPLEASMVFTLQATATNGCSDSSKIWVLVRRKLAMPNAFTPNGDGINDVFRIPAGVDIELKGFSVFDRWGNVVFTTKDATTGWDGRFNNKQVPTGVYVYLLQGTYDGKPVTVKGTFMLAK